MLEFLFEVKGSLRVFPSFLEAIFLKFIIGFKVIKSLLPRVEAFVLQTLERVKDNIKLIK